MLGLGKKIKSLIFLLFVVVTQQLSPLEWSDSMVKGASFGAGVAVCAGSLASVHFRENKPITKEAIIMSLFMGGLLGFVTHSFLIKKTPEWQKKNENQVFTGALQDFKKSSEDVKKSIHAIEGQLPKAGEDILTYTIKTHGTPWPLCTEHAKLKKFKEEALHLKTTIEKTQKSLSEFVSTKIEESLFDGYQFKDQCSELSNQVIVEAGNISNVIKNIDHSMDVIIKHPQYLNQVTEEKRICEQMKIDAQEKEQERQYQHARDMARAAALASAQALQETTVAVEQVCLNHESAHVRQQRAQLQQQCAQFQQQCAQLEAEVEELRNRGTHEVQELRSRGAYYAQQTTRTNNQITQLQSKIRELEQRLSTQVPAATGVSGQAAQVVDDCSICQDSLSGSGLVTTRCHHRFHGACLEGWKRRGMLNSNKCPVCRTVF